MLMVCPTGKRTTKQVYTQPGLKLNVILTPALPPSPSSRLCIDFPYLPRPISVSYALTAPNSCSHFPPSSTLSQCHFNHHVRRTISRRRDKLGGYNDIQKVLLEGRFDCPDFCNSPCPDLPSFCDSVDLALRKLGTYLSRKFGCHALHPTDSLRSACI